MTVKKLSLISLLGLAAILFLRETVMATPVTLQTAEYSSPSQIEPAAGKSEYPPPPPPNFNETLAATANAMNDAIHISPSKSEVIRLDQDAASVIVSNPAHAAIMLDSPRVLIVLPKAPGATSFTVLDSSGKTIMEKKVIVSSGREPYVRIRKVCSGGQAGCASNSYYYCPDGCYEVSTDAISQTTTGTVPEIPASSGGASAPKDDAGTQGNDVGEEEIPDDEGQTNDTTGEQSPAQNAPPPLENGETGGEQ